MTGYSCSVYRSGEIKIWPVPLHKTDTASSRTAESAPVALCCRYMFFVNIAVQVDDYYGPTLLY